jgi:hypothetical protein
LLVNGDLFVKIAKPHRSWKNMFAVKVFDAVVVVLEVVVAMLDVVVVVLEVVVQI